MTHPRPKILQLAWEFPPLLTGGLGIACYGLSKALSSYADLTVIVPRSDADFKISQFKLIGLNHIKLEEVENERDTHDYRKFSTLKEISISLDPYSMDRVDEVRGIQRHSLKNRPTVEVNAAEARALFGDRDVYGPNIMQKVAAFTEVACKLAETLDFDLIHAHDWITYTAAVRIKRESGKPLVLHVHSLETDRVNERARNTVYYIEQRGMQHADFVLPVSNFTRQNIIQYYGIDPSKLKTVYNGVEPVHKFRSVKPNGEKWVVFLGRITRQKGPFMILETARKLIRRMPLARFVVAGVGDQLGQLKLAVEQEGLASFFIFTGFISKAEVATLLSKADVYFMPSISEPFGLSAVEAAQFDVPCVISKQSGVAEVMPNALKADFWDTDKFSDLLYAVLNFEGIRETVTGNTQRDLEKISWHIAAERVAQIYSELI